MMSDSNDPEVLEELESYQYVEKLYGLARDRLDANKTYEHNRYISNNKCLDSREVKKILKKRKDYS